MPEYKTSQQAIFDLSRDHPSSPFLYGLAKTAGGLALAAASTLAVAAPFLNLIPGEKTVSDTLERCVSAPLGIVGLFFAFRRILPDGVVSTLSHLLPEGDETQVYFHNGGFTSSPSWADRRYGSRVQPIDSPGAIYASKGFVFMNNVILSDAKAYDTHFTECTSSSEDLERLQSPFNLVAGAHFGNYNFNTSMQSGESQISEVLRLAQSQSPLYLAGRKSADSASVDIVACGESFKVRAMS